MELFDRRGRPSPRLYNEQANDPWIVALRAYLEDGAIPLDPYLQNLVVRNSQQYLMQQGIVCRYVTIKTPLRNPELIIVPAIPHSLVEEVLYASHASPVSGHLGHMKTRERIRRTAYWLNWQLDCEDYVSKCPDCNRAKGGRPWRQGLVERFNHTIVQMMKIYVDDHHTDWDTYLPRLLFAYRTAHHETLGDSPHFCLFGRDPTLPLDLAFLNADPAWKSDDLPQYKRRLASSWKEMRRLVENQMISGQNKSAAAKSDQKPISFDDQSAV
ncbi:hypothetical protein Ae201684P_022442 [Aphanomyces euteiches]|nr:hypothetical protein Ae201684P_022442 [Aphanomyces euteiches]